MHLWGETDEIACLRNGRSGRVALRVPSWSITDEEGRPVPMCQLVRPTGASRMQLADLWHSHWREIDRDSFEAHWVAELEEALSKVDVETISVGTGLLLPVWHKLPEDDVRVWRIDDPSGTSILGRIVMPAAVEKLQSEFGLEQAIRLTPDEIIGAAREGEGALVPGLDEARLISAFVNGSRRLEIRNFPGARLAELKALGCFTEVIAYKTRLFVPYGTATDVLEAIGRVCNPK